MSRLRIDNILAESDANSSILKIAGYSSFNTKSIPHSGQEPGPSDLTSGCIGQV